MVMSRLPVLLLATLLAACAVGPDYQAPATMPATYINADSAVYSSEAFESQWWRQLEDSVLDDLVARGMAANTDLRLATARLREARALFRDAQLDQLPTVTAGAAHEHSKAQQPGMGNQRIESERYQFGFDAAWEIDLFGRVRRASEAARAEAEGAEAGVRDAQVSVAAEIARNYFELRGAQRRIAVAERNRSNLVETVRLMQVRYELGRSSELELAASQARLSATEAGIPPLLTSERRAAHRLAVLLGQRPGTLDAELVAAERAPLLKPLAIGNAEDLLRRRPDVRIAERNLAAATARIGVATADLFPRLSLGGFIGFLSGDAAQLGESASQAWSIAPSLSWAALDLGSVRARMRASEARADSALATYERTVLVALEDTENAFVGYSQQQSRLASLGRQIAASRRAADLARIQYREGLIDYLRLLDAETTLLQAEDAVADAQTGLQTGVVAIYKALGGGWGAAEVASYQP